MQTCAVVPSACGADVAAPATSQDAQHGPTALKHARGSTDVVEANVVEVETVIVSDTGGPLVVPHATGAISLNKDMELVSDNSAEPSGMTDAIAGDSMVAVEAFLDTAPPSPLDISANSLVTTENGALETAPNTLQPTTDTLTTPTAEETHNVVSSKTPGGKYDKEVADPSPMDAVVCSTTTNPACDRLEQNDGMEGASDVVDTGLGTTVHAESTATAETVSEEHVYENNKRTNPDTAEKIDKRPKKTTTQNDTVDS